MSVIIGIDPGSKKCGVVLVDYEKLLVLDGLVLKKSYVRNQLILWRNQIPFQKIFLGNGTTSKYWKELLEDLAPIQLVEEKETTLRARKRYWELWPASSWLFWVPNGLRIPPKNLDAVVAMILIEDYFKKKLKWPGEPKF